MPVWAHSNLSLAAAVMVAIHLGVGARDLNPLAIFTWIAAGLFVVAMLSGSYGFIFTTIPSRRRHWIKFHRTLTNVFYVAIIPHILIRSFGVWTAAVLIIALFLVWIINPRIAERLKTINWPLHKALRSKGKDRRPHDFITPVATVPHPSHGPTVFDGDGTWEGDDVVEANVRCQSEPPPHRISAVIPPVGSVLPFCISSAAYATTST